MSPDSLFYSERKPFRKTALLFTVPCAILPIIMATAGLMSVPFSPLFFKYDFILFAAVYLVYFYGLFLSRQAHKKWIPFISFAIHLSSLLLFIYWSHNEWLGYISVVSIMATSVVNQYYRVGSLACNEGCDI